MHVDSLLDKNTKKKVLFSLDRLPKGSNALDEAYNDAIERIKGQLPEKSMLARKVLSWITYTQRPLSTGELCHALAVEPEELELDQDNIPDIEDIFSVCAGLVTVDDESNIIRLVHYTTQVYFFEHIRESWNPQAQQEIASMCLTYMSFKPFANGPTSSDEHLKTRLAENPFFEYAAMNWAQHVLAVQREVSELALSFLQDEALIASTCQMTSSYSRYYWNYSPIFPPKLSGLHLTAGFGLSVLVEELLCMISGTNLVDANSKDEEGRTPLSWAAENGHEAVVKLLLTRDAEADSKDENGRTPLSWAAENGHEAVVKLLITRDAKANSKDNYGRTPLLWAAKNGHEAVVKLLVERDDTEADSKDEYGRTPLSWAAENGHEAVVKLLITRDAKANSKDKYGRTPLSFAAGNGHEAVVKLLIERDDVEVDRKDQYSRTPLSFAARNGHEAVVKLLLARDDVEADSKNNDGETPLFIAIEQGHEAVVKLLQKKPSQSPPTRIMNEMRLPLLYQGAPHGDQISRMPAATVR